MIELSARDARRIAVRAQLLGAARPAGLLEVAQHLAAVQVDQTSYVAPNADLVFWSRLGHSYAPEDLIDALESRELVEIRGFLRAADDVRLFTAEMAAMTPSGHPAGTRPRRSGSSTTTMRARRCCRRCAPTAR